METEKPRRGRVKLSVGDLFEFAVPDGRLAYGMIIRRGALENGRSPYIAIFRSLHAQRPDLNQVVNDEVALCGWSLDALFYHGRWTVIAHGIPLPRVPFPNFKVSQDGRTYVTDVEGNFIGLASKAEQELLDFQFGRAPIGFQNALEAIHGFRSWEEHYEQLTPAYAARRISRPR